MCRFGTEPRTMHTFENKHHYIHRIYVKIQSIRTYIYIYRITKIPGRIRINQSDQLNTRLFTFNSAYRYARWSAWIFCTHYKINVSLLLFYKHKQINATTLLIRHTLVLCSVKAYNTYNMSSCTYSVCAFVNYWHSYTLEQRKQRERDVFMFLKLVGYCKTAPVNF